MILNVLEQTYYVTQGYLEFSLCYLQTVLTFSRRLIRTGCLLLFIANSKEPA